MQLPNVCEPLCPADVRWVLQTGLFQLVRDYPVAEFKQNVLALTNTAKLYGVPTILTTSLAGK